MNSSTTHRDGEFYQADAHGLAISSITSEEDVDGSHEAINDKVKS
jgi:hypothetical protein